MRNNKKDKIVKVCLNCPKELLVLPCHIGRKFCSSLCSSKYRRGKPLSVEHRCHIGEALFGITRSEETRNKIRKANLGKKVDRRIVEKIIRTVVAKGLKGEKHWNWRGGKEVLPNCIDCGKKLTHKDSKRCIDCAGKLKSGENHCHWKGGITPLQVGIRNLQEYTIWRTRVYEKDHFTCQQCKQVSGKLEAHHIRPFATLLKRLLKKYSQFSPIKDKETLIRLATKYKPFWDTDNGETLCKNCHSNLRAETREVIKESRG